MRKLLPRIEYKLLKSRKCARLNRSRRKEQTEILIAENKRLLAENAILRQKLGMPPVNSNEVDSFDTVSEQENDDSGGAVSKLEIRMTAGEQDLADDGLRRWEQTSTNNKSISIFEESEQIVRTAPMDQIALQANADGPSFS